MGMRRSGPRCLSGEKGNTNCTRLPCHEIFDLRPIRRSASRFGRNILPGREPKRAAPVESPDGKASKLPSPLLPVWSPAGG
jgi:hypothetical protein